ncbi:MAG: hypothetical protein BWY09_01013 [Candidatus Hydrogenedentes bacterium ADurb.Bin179]|nr:MAG: hypothetical protein BWY09_01013 [Candidatus Hydrogenedentes bacterium ADurb.Bin179]
MADTQADDNAQVVDKGSIEHTSACGKPFLRHSTDGRARIPNAIVITAQAQAVGKADVLEGFQVLRYRFHPAYPPHNDRHSMRFRPGNKMYGEGLLVNPGSVGEIQPAFYSQVVIARTHPGVQCNFQQVGSGRRQFRNRVGLLCLARHVDEGRKARDRIPAPVADTKL